MDSMLRKIQGIFQIFMLAALFFTNIFDRYGNKRVI